MATSGFEVQFVLVTLAMVIGVCSATTFTVGDKSGWTIPTSTSFYPDWAKKSFQVGDKLVFNFPVGAHTVAEVSKSDYDACTGANPISAVKNSGPATYTLSAGTHYYICTVTGHCGANQKLAVTVSGSSTAPSPVPSSKKTPATAPSTTTPGPSSSLSPTSSGPSPSGTTPPPAKNFASPAAAGVGFFSLMALGVVALF